MPRRSAGPAPAFLKRLSRKKSRPIFSASRPFFAAAAPSLVKAGFETLVEAGYQPEMAYFECCHELKLIVDLIYKKGLVRDAQRYQQHRRVRRPDRRAEDHRREGQETDEKALDRIQSGAFAREWIKENKEGCKNFNALREKDKNHQIEKVGGELRGMMHWLKK